MQFFVNLIFLKTQLILILRLKIFELRTDYQFKKFNIFKFFQGYFLLEKRNYPIFVFVIQIENDKIKKKKNQRRNNLTGKTSTQLLSVSSRISIKALVIVSRRTLFIKPVNDTRSGSYLLANLEFQSVLFTETFVHLQLRKM